MSNAQWNEDQALGEQALRKHQRIVDNAENMLKALEGVSEWCHQGHGNYPIKHCGLCRPVVEAIAKARGPR